jgi:hypothetical protein
VIGRRPVEVASTLVILASVAAVFLVPKSVQWVALIICLALIGANFARVLWGFREERRRAEAIVAAHPGETAFGTGLIALDEVSASDKARVVAVIVTKNGLSFRDRDDAEVGQVAAARILSIELAPLEPRKIRPAIVTLIDGAPVRFYVGGGPDQQAEAILAIRTALGRPAG